MTRRFCPNCGAALEFSVQQFCTSCGAQLPDLPQAPDPGVRVTGSVTHSGMPIWIFILAGILVLGAGFVLLFPHLSPASSSLPASPVSSEDRPSLTQPPSGTPMNGVTPVSTTVTAVTVGVTGIMTRTRTTELPPSPTTVPVTLVPTPTTTPLPATTLPTPEPTIRPTSVITLAVTLVPAQPSTSSLTSSTVGAPALDPDALESRVHELINVQRQQNGLSSLSYDPFLADIARGHSWDMASRNFFEHVNPDGKSPRDRGDVAGYPCIRHMGVYTYSGIAENLYQGNRYGSYYATPDGVITSYNWNTPDQIAESAVTGWMNSPGHRENILTPHYSYEGIGIAFSADDKIYITENFC
jgi:uncharacterized protein YkwD